MKKKLESIFKTNNLLSFDEATAFRPCDAHRKGKCRDGKHIIDTTARTIFVGNGIKGVGGFSIGVEAAFIVTGSNNVAIGNGAVGYPSAAPFGNVGHAFLYMPCI